MNRAEWLVSMIHAHGFTCGVELGVKSGGTLRHILESCHDVLITGVDLWASTPGYESWDHDAYKQTAIELLYEYSGRLRLIQACTWDSADNFHDGTLDFVFVDGDHRTDSVIKDITAWRPKLRHGGMLAGHDVGWPSVRSALDQCAPTYQHAEHDGCWFVMI